MQKNYKEFLISDELERLDVEAICALLKTTYWAETRSEETVRASLEHSMVFGVYSGPELIGFARCVTDWATMYYLCDVVIRPDCRGMGVGSALLEFVSTHPALRGLVGILATKDAFDFYKKFGYVRTDNTMRRPPESPV